MILPPLIDYIATQHTRSIIPNHKETTREKTYCNSYGRHSGC